MAPYAAAIRTVERQKHLEELLAAGADVSGVIAACLGPPLYATRFHEGFGTLYTAEYRPAEGSVVTTGRANPGSSPWASSSPVVSGSISEPRNRACQMTRQTRPTWPGSAWTLPRSGVTDSAAGWRVIRSRSRGPEAAA